MVKGGGSLFLVPDGYVDQLVRSPPCHGGGSRVRAPS